jgi:hypothetical protein
MNRRALNLFLAMTNPTPHPALFAPDLAATFTSTTTGHAFSLGSGRHVHESATTVYRSTLENLIL